MSDLVLVSSKPHTTRVLIEVLAKGGHQWVGRNILFVHTLYVGPFQFDYPRGLAWSTYPMTKAPAYKLRQDRDLMPRRLEDGKLVALPDAEGWDALRDVKDVVYAADPDHTEVMVFNLMMEHVGRATDVSETPFVFMKSLREVHIMEAVRDSSTCRIGAEGSQMLGYGMAKHYFDFNWNTNAQVVLGRILQQVGARPGARVPSKYGLQLLYHIRRNADQPKTDNDLFTDMESGRMGTGRYGAAQMGSPASRSEILHQVLESGLAITVQPLAKGRPIWALSPLGEAFLAALHPDCEDMDLAPRLNAWCEIGLAEAKPKIDRYLKTYFGKAKRFAPSRHV